jgi:hypothetical protein
VPTEPQLLSPLDHLFLGHAISLVLHYPERLEAGRLSASLEEVLRVTPLLAGGLVEHGAGPYAVGPCPIQEQRLEVREVAVPPAPADAPGEWVPTLAPGLGQPLLAARLALAPSSSVLGVTVSHALMDGYGLFLLLRAWSRAAMGRPVEALPTDRRLLEVQVPESATPLTPEEFRRRTGFTWLPGSRRRVDGPPLFGTRLAPPEPRTLAEGAGLSDNDVLCAWLIKTHAQVLSGPEGLAVAIPIEYRQSHGGLPRNYLGNAIRAAPLWLPRDVLEREPLVSIAARVQEATRSSVDGQAARDSLVCLNQLLREQGPRVLDELHLADPRLGFLVTNISRMPFGTIDLGRGPPSSVHLPAMEERTAAIQQDDEGLVVSLCLPSP